MQPWHKLVGLGKGWLYARGYDISNFDLLLQQPLSVIGTLRWVVSFRSCNTDMDTSINILHRGALSQQQLLRYNHIRSICSWTALRSSKRGDMTYTLWWYTQVVTVDILDMMSYRWGLGPSKQGDKRESFVYIFRLYWISLDVMKVGRVEVRDLWPINTQLSVYHTVAEEIAQLLLIRDDQASI